MSSSRLRRQELINLGLFAISLIPVFLYLFLIYQRINLPFDLEWGEGAGINQIYRILSGKPLYGPPDLEFAPLVYTPLYYWFASLLSRLGLPVILAARLISILASFGSAAVAARLVIQETDNRMAGWLASVLFLACFGLSDGFYDLVRVDSMYVFVLLITFSVLRNASKPLGLSSAGFLIAAGFFIKQSALLVFIPIILYLLVKDWKTAWPLILSMMIGIILPFYWINSRSGGWFNYYILRLPQEHGFSLISAVDFWVGDLLGPLGIASGFGLIYLVSRLKSGDKPEIERSGSWIQVQDNKHSALFFALFALGTIGTGWITRASNGGGVNNAMSAYASLSLLFGLGFFQMSEWSSRRGEKPELVAGLVACIAAIQFIGLIYNPFNFLPTTEEVQTNEDLLTYFSETEGLIWAPYRSHLPGLVNKNSSIHAVNLFEMTGYFKGNILPEGIDLVDQIRKNICDQVYSVIMLDQPIPWVEQQIIAAYEIDNRFSDYSGARKSPLLDWQGGFASIYIPRQGIDPIECLEQNHGD